MESARDYAIKNPNKFVDLPSTAIGTIVTVWSPASGKTITLQGFEISVSAAVSVLVEDNAAGQTKLWRTPTLEAGKPYRFVLPGSGRQLAAVDRVVKFTGSGAANAIGTLWGRED